MVQEWECGPYSRCVPGLKASCALNSVTGSILQELRDMRLEHDLAQRAQSRRPLSPRFTLLLITQGHKPASSMWLPVKTDAYLDLKYAGDLTKEIYIFPEPVSPSTHRSPLQCSSQHQELLEEQRQKPVTC